MCQEPYLDVRARFRTTSTWADRTVHRAAEAGYDTCLPLRAFDQRRRSLRNKICQEGVIRR
jgi:hypothetical protein